MDELEAAERWLPVPGWDDLYRVSDQGRMFSIRANRVLKPYPDRNGYLLIALCRRGSSIRYLVHRLVTAAFIGPPLAGQQVRHGPHGRADNRLANLCYGTPAENMADQVRDGTSPVGSRNGFSRLTESVVQQCRLRYGAGETCTAMAAELGVSLSTIYLAVTGKTWRHIGAMTADDLERAIWAAMRRHNIPAAAPGAEHFVGEVLRAAEAYAAGDSDDVTLRRRQVLARDGWAAP